MLIQAAARKVALLASGLLAVALVVLGAPGPAGAASTFPEVRWHAGIIDEGQAPLPGPIYAIENKWLGNVGNENVGVYAGAYRHDPAQGVVVVVAHSLDLTSSSNPVIYRMGHTGALRIVGANGSLLILASETGRKLKFVVPGTLQLFSHLGG